MIPARAQQRIHRGNDIFAIRNSTQLDAREYCVFRILALDKRINANNGNTGAADANS